MKTEERLQRYSKEALIGYLCENVHLIEDDFATLDRIAWFLEARAILARMKKITAEQGKLHDYQPKYWKLERERGRLARKLEEINKGICGV